MIRLRNGSIDCFQKRIQGKKLYCFGYGDQAKMFFNRHKEAGLVQWLENIVDNDLRKAGTVVNVDGKPVKILTFEEFAGRSDRDAVLLVTSVYCVDILSQLDREPRLDGLETYVNLFIDSVSAPVPFRFTEGPAPRIPKKIHYCWFGEKPIPEKLQGYMRTWRELCPDYEIIRWDESNYDIGKNRYMQQAYEAKKWGFVPDYARLDIIFEHGGIYLDTDVELIRPLDSLLYDEMFCGFEQSGYINFGNGFGAAKLRTRKLCRGS